MNSKLINELSDLVTNKVITQDTASRIEQYVLSKQQHKPNKLFTVFGVLGSLLIGLGVILILAHNWDNFTRSIKTVFAFLPLVIGQIFVAFSVWKKKSSVWKESSGTFLFFAIGSSIALVSQIYNIPGNLSTYILTWIVLSLPLIYILKSNTVALLNMIAITYYACEVGYSFSSFSESPWLYLVLMTLILPHYYSLLKNHTNANITSVFNWLFPLSVTIVLGTFVSQLSELGFLMYLLLFSLYYNMGKLPFFNEQKLRRNGYLVQGSLGIVIMVLTMSFDDFWYLERFFFNAQETYVSAILCAANVGLLIYSYSKGWLKTFNLFQYLFILFSILYVFGLNIPIVGTIVVNLMVLALGITTIKIGADKFHFGILNYGLLIITALVTCRFFDTNMSFVIRGLLFVSVGIGFFLTNYILLKKQKSKVESLKH
ncbi:DUF2157 domain-containing protein [Psychroserpens sp. SPM9]|uniref:DUF2157 domain-containing protein n=1 Tax=Psychroserpens sp. SPM9 TaxID=2975598 RepID=UPI0021A73F89|nr:DUF2157 domain-containing protein [Psychroserpens sp. SPM9]MDG5489942.1 DUF2157 domain-containing protein [Psychroserpens sp. SPM9]